MSDVPQFSQQMSPNADGELASAVDRLRTGEAVTAYEIFLEIAADVLGVLFAEHPLPRHLDVRILYGSMTVHEPDLTARFFRTVDFLEAEGFIRRLPARPRSPLWGASEELGGVEDLGHVGLTLRGLGALAQSPAGRDTTLGETLMAGAKEGAGTAAKSAAREGVAYVIEQAIRWFGFGG